MFSVVALIIIVAIILPALFVVGSVIPRLNTAADCNEAENTHGGGGGGGGGYRDVSPPPAPAPTQAPVPTPAPAPPPSGSYLHYSGHDNADRYAGSQQDPRSYRTSANNPPSVADYGGGGRGGRDSNREIPRPADTDTTPVTGNAVEHDQRRDFQPPAGGGYFQPSSSARTNNHYRSTTPFRPVTPVNNSNNRGEPETPSRADVLDRRDANIVTNRNVYRRYDELAPVEKKAVVDLTSSRILVSRRALDPILEPFREKLDGQFPRYIIAYFGKEGEKFLRPYERLVRRSFRIKDDGFNLCRYARLSVDGDENLWKLYFHDYTPYIEDNAPKFDAITMDFSKERSRWEPVIGTLSFRTQEICTASLNVLVPASQ